MPSVQGWEPGCLGALGGQSMEIPGSPHRCPWSMGFAGPSHPVPHVVPSAVVPLQGQCQDGCVELDGGGARPGRLELDGTGQCGVSAWGWGQKRGAVSHQLQPPQPWLCPGALLLASSLWGKPLPLGPGLEAQMPGLSTGSGRGAGQAGSLDVGVFPLALLHLCTARGCCDPTLRLRVAERAGRGPAAHTCAWVCA